MYSTATGSEFGQQSEGAGKEILLESGLQVEHSWTSTFFFWLHHVACGILVSRPGTEPVPPAVEAQRPNHWTTRDFPWTSWTLMEPCETMSCEPAKQCLDFWPMKMVR